MDNEANALPEVREIIEAVKAKMEARGETVEDVRVHIGVKSYQQVWDWLNYKKGNPKLQSLSVLRSYLELPDEKKTAEFR